VDDQNTKNRIARERFLSAMRISHYLELGAETPDSYGGIRRVALRSKGEEIELTMECGIKYWIPAPVLIRDCVDLESERPIPNDGCQSVPKTGGIELKENAKERAWKRWKHPGRFVRVSLSIDESDEIWAGKAHGIILVTENGFELAISFVGILFYCEPAYGFYGVVAPWAMRAGTVGCAAVRRGFVKRALEQDAFGAFREVRRLARKRTVRFLYRSYDAFEVPEDVLVGLLLRMKKISPRDIDRVRIRRVYLDDTKESVIIHFLGLAESEVSTHALELLPHIDERFAILRR